MDRFVIKLVFARPTKRYQLVGDPIPPPANGLDHRHKRQKDRDLSCPWDQKPINRTNNMQLVARTMCPSAAMTSRSGPTGPAYLIRRSAVLAVRSTISIRSSWFEVKEPRN
jgi:hypothetical protein